MDINNYISSGVLELYASGLLSPEEVGEVEEMIAKYPEIKAELMAIEESLAVHASQFYKAPKPALLDSIMARIEEEEEKEQVEVQDQPQVQDQTQVQDQPQDQTQTQAEERTTIGDFQGKKEPKVRKFNLLSLMAVAATLLLLISVISNVVLYQQLSETEQALASLQDQQDTNVKEFEALRTNYNIVTDTAYKPVHIHGLPSHENAFATVYWNPINQAIYLDASFMDAPDADKTYQLWAIKAGQDPISLGVFDTLDSLQDVAAKIGGDVAAFAVSLEPKGGSEQPTDVWMVGNVG